MSLVLVSTTSFTSQTTVNIDNCFSASYFAYLMKTQIAAGAGDSTTSILGRMRVGGSSDSGTNYRRQEINATNTTTGAGRSTAQTSFGNVIGDNKVTGAGFNQVWIVNPFDAVRTSVLTCAPSYAATNALEYRNWLFGHDLSTSYDGITITSSASMTGTIWIWGLAKS